MSDVNPIAVRLRNVSKAYRIWRSPESRIVAPLLARTSRLLPPGRIRERVLDKAKRLYRDVYALNSVSFELRRGEAIGIMGRNGAGKSTLLQIIAGSLLQTSGDVERNGRISALLELGSGFNPNFTGKENVYLNASILGLTMKETEERYRDIVDFAEIGDYIDRPVSTYSTGMIMRLAFSVQIAIDPDILIVDEALAVGDAPFQTKCYNRLRARLDKGMTLLLVSHAAGVVRNFCDRAIWLKDGEAMQIGPTKEVCDAYDKYCWQSSGMQLEKGGAPPVEEHEDSAGEQREGVADVASSGDGARSTFSESAARSRIGTGEVRISDFYLKNLAGERVESVGYDEDILAVYELRAEASVDCDFVIGLTVKDVQGTELLRAIDFDKDVRLTVEPGERLVAEMRTRLPLRAGQYYVSTGLFAFTPGQKYATGRIDFSTSSILDRVEYAAFFTVLTRERFPLSGPVHSDAFLSLQAG